jgi:hypothetical protein
MPPDDGLPSPLANLRLQVIGGDDLSPFDR